MSRVDSCCQTSREAPVAQGVCTHCRSIGHPVPELTIKSLLTEPALRRFAPGRYRFCPTPACKVVYFDDAGHCFTSHQLRVPVWQKERVGSRTICYCFDEGDASIRADIEQHGSSRVVARVREHIAAGRCACEVRNPRGTCCLGDLTRAVQEAGLE